VVLGIPSQRASADEINAAWKRLMRTAHPDAGGSDDLAARINAARDEGLKAVAA
jgi:curved DNA-binding protein CbpA